MKPGHDKKPGIGKPLISDKPNQESPGLPSELSKQSQDALVAKSLKPLIDLNTGYIWLSGHAFRNSTGKDWPELRKWLKKPLLDEHGKSMRYMTITVYGRSFKARIWPYDGILNRHLRWVGQGQNVAYEPLCIAGPRDLQQQRNASPFDVEKCWPEEMDLVWEMPEEKVVTTRRSRQPGKSAADRALEKLRERKTCNE